MKAVPIAQYLDQKSRAAATGLLPMRRESLPIAPKLAPPANDSKPQRAAMFQRLPRAPLAAEDEGESPRWESNIFRPRETPPPPADLETQLAEAYQRGVREGLDTAQTEAANERARERVEQQKRAVVERLDFEVNEYARLADLISNGLIEVERRIAEVVARLLQPFVSQAVSNQVVEELARNLARLSSAGRPGLIKIRGPEGLLNALKAPITDLAVDVEYVVEQGVEVTVEAHPTSIGSQIGPWAELLASLSAPA
jgi:flagellar biosynthesis/type III secretory pathway protein FliH